MQRLAAVVLTASCAACGDDGVQTPADATMDTTPAVRCDPAKPFGAPRYLNELSTAKAEYGARLYDDERTILFSRRSAATNAADLFMAIRASRDVPFDAPTPLTTVNSVSNDQWSTQAVDGLALMFEADRGQAAGAVRPWISRRADIANPWGPPMVVPELGVGDARLYLANATALYFVSSEVGGANKNDIYRAEVGASVTIGPRVVLAGTVSSSESEEAPAVTPDELAIYFRRSTTTVDNTNPMTPVTTIEYDIWGATRGSAMEDFGPPALVENLSAPGVIETPSWISADGCVIYASSDSPNDSDDGDIVVAARPL